MDKVHGLLRSLFTFILLINFQHSQGDCYSLIGNVFTFQNTTKILTNHQDGYVNINKWSK